jgi:trehalose/maltose hydrolase-like predicted phosphorylase
MKLKFLLVASLLLSSRLFSQVSIQNSPWHIPATNIDPDNYFGITCANGIIGLVSSPEPMQVSDVVLNGVYDHYKRGRVSNILKTFNHVNMMMNVDDERLGRSNISNYAQVLDMKRAILTTTFDFKDKATVKHQMMALRHLPYSALSIVEVTAKQDIKITPYSVIEAPDHLSQVSNFFQIVDRPEVMISLTTSTAKSPSGSLDLAASTSFVFDEPHGSEPQLIHEDWDYNLHHTKFNKQLKAGETYRFAVVGASCSSKQYQDPYNEVERLNIFAKLEGIDRLVRLHTQAWEELWQSDIIVDGDLRSQRAIRSALYHLYSFARAGTAYSLSPMGLSGLGYNGHVFWDTEMWMYPPLLMMQPDIAQSLLDYRFERMGAARQNAFAHGFKGVMFPWESADDGSEDTPIWAITGPFQHHITADIGWSYWKYYQLTKDKEWLRQKGYPMLKEVAEFWTSRVDRKGPGQYHIDNVIGANEWEENINNNAYTNGMAKIVLNYATLAAQELGLQADSDWLQVADNIPVLKFENGVTRENATYEGQMIKQADVNLLAFPLNYITEPEQVRKDLEYYEPRMSPQGPAMGFSVLSALHARLGDEEKAFELFEQSYQPNEVPPFGVLAETAGGTNPYFATGAGGMLQAVLSGFGGLEITNDGVVQKKTLLPKHWKSLTIKGVGKDQKTFTIKR